MVPSTATSPNGETGSTTADRATKDRTASSGATAMGRGLNRSWILRQGMATALGATALAAPLGLAHAASADSALQVRIPATSAEILAVGCEQGRLSVRAQHVPLGRILEELARRSDLEVRGLANADQVVSVS